MKLNVFDLFDHQPLVVCFTVSFSLAEKKMRFRAKNNQCNLGINCTAESQSDCKDNQ